MASSSSNGEEKSNKRKVDEIDPETTIKTKTEKKPKAKKKSKNEASNDDLSNIVNGITVHHINTIQEWKRVVTNLTKAGIVVRKDDVREGHIMWRWSGDDDVYIKLSLIFCRRGESPNFAPEYQVSCNPGSTRNFKTDEWDELVEHLIESKKKAEHKASCTRILDYLETETQAWKELIDALNESKDVPRFSDCSIDDGLITLEWTCKDKGFKVTVERRTKCNELGDLYEVYCVQKKSLKTNDGSIAESDSYVGYVHDVVDRIAELLE